MPNTASIDYRIKKEGKEQKVNILLSEIEKNGLAEALVNKGVLKHKIEDFKIIASKIFFSEEKKEAYQKTGAFTNAGIRKFRVKLNTLPDFEKFPTLPQEYIVEAVHEGRAIIIALHENGVRNFPAGWQNTKCEVVVGDEQKQVTSNG